MRISIGLKCQKAVSIIPVEHDENLYQIVENACQGYHLYLKSFLNGTKPGFKLKEHFYSHLYVPDRKIIDGQIIVYSRKIYWYIESENLELLAIIAKRIKLKKNIQIENSLFYVGNVEFFNFSENIFDFLKQDYRFLKVDPETPFEEKSIFNNFSAIKDKMMYLLGVLGNFFAIENNLTVLRPVTVDLKNKSSDLPINHIGQV